MGVEKAARKLISFYFKGRAKKPRMEPLLKRIVKRKIKIHDKGIIHKGIIHKGIIHKGIIHKGIIHKDILPTVSIKTMSELDPTLDLLRKVHATVQASLSLADLQELANKCDAISRHCKGDGAGLAAGTLTDILVSGFFKTKIATYSDCHTGESDLKIDDLPLSMKKINGKSTVALDWSKNETDVKKEHFSCPVMILNLQTQRWWKKKPTTPLHYRITWNDTIPAGFYFVSNQFCKANVQLGKNNKTNTLITEQYLYTMLKDSLDTGLHIAMPAPNEELHFVIWDAFTK